MRKLLFCAILALCLLFAERGAARSQGYAFSYAIAGGFLDTPQGLAYDNAGALYVAQGNTNRVQKFAPDGSLLLSLGAGYNGVPGFITMSGSANGQFQRPIAVAVDAGGNIYVVDFSSYIQKFRADGTFLLKFGGPGSGPGRFSGAGGLAVDGAGNLWVADAGANRVQKLDSSGNFLAAIGAGYNGVAGNIGAAGIGPGQFNYPAGVALDSAGALYIADASNRRIQKFSPQGQFLLAFGAGYNGVPGAIGSDGTAPGSLERPEGVAVDQNGNVYAYSGVRDPVQVYDASGHPTIGIGAGIFGGYNFSGVFSIALDGQGRLAVPTGSGGQIYIVSLTGAYISQLNFYTGAASGQFIMPQGIALDGAGNSYVVDNLGQRLQKFDKSGRFLQSLGPVPTPPDSLAFPRGYFLATDNSGHLYISDAANNRIVKLDLNGNFLLAFGSFGPNNGQFNGVGAIATDAAGNVYAVDAGSNRVEKFNPQGQFVMGFGAGYNGAAGQSRQSGSGAGQFSQPGAVTVDSAGALYVADKGNNRLEKFDSNGNYLTSFQSANTGAGGFQYVSGLAVDSSGAIYAASGLANTLAKYDRNGQFILNAGGLGTGPGQFDGLSGFAMDGAGALYVTETGANRVQVLAPTDNLSGAVTLDGIDDLTAITVPLPPVTAQFRAVGSSAALFTLGVPLAPDAADHSKGAFTLKGLPPGIYDIALKSSDSLQVTLHRVAVAGNASAPAIPLPGGDADNNNSVDSADFGLLIGAFNTNAAILGSGYDSRIDFNSDGAIDSSDFGILIINYGAQGDP